MIFLWSHIIPDHDQILILLHTSGLPARVHVFTESSAFIWMDHESREEKSGDCDRVLAIQIYVVGYRSGGDQLFQGNAQISELAQSQPVEKIFQLGVESFLAYRRVKAYAAADGKRPCLLPRCRRL